MDRQSENFETRGALIVLLFLMLVAAGCRREEIAVYRVPKEKQAEATGGEVIRWNTPAGWEQQAPGGMSVASLLIPGDAGRKAQLSVMTFPGKGAGELDLINIVRGNAGLPPLNGQELGKLVEKVNVGSEEGKLVDLTGAINSSNEVLTNSILVAVYPRGGTTWFFKLVGDAGVVTAQKQTFLDFLKSVSFVAGGDQSAHTSLLANANAGGAIPGGQPEETETPNAAPEKPSWDVPAGWRETAPGPMVLARFELGGNANTEVTVSAFPGDTGGLLANVNRWRGQVGLQPLDQSGVDEQVTSLDVMGGKAMLVDVNGTGAKTGKPTRLVGAIWPRGGETWFYKLMGDPQLVEQQKAAFTKFIQSVRYSNAP